MNANLKVQLQQFARGEGRLLVLTGAGISAESGIPTFRGKEGYWTVGSTEYHPQEMATYSMFRKVPMEVWKWYLYRRGVCQQAQPNLGHLALARLEEALGKRFTLVTQNVDGLHLRAGNSLEKTYQIHGNINYMRCSVQCSDQIYPIPATIDHKSKDDLLSPEEMELLVCPRCGESSRPHVLWFDESYDEALFKFESTLRAVSKASMLWVVGTSGATTLPNYVVSLASQNGVSIIDINPEENVFSQTAIRSQGGAHLKSASGEVLPEMADALIGALNLE